MLTPKQLAFCQSCAFWFSLIIGGVLLYMLLNTPDGTKRPGMYMLIWLYFAAQIMLGVASAALAQALSRSLWLWGAIATLLGPLGGVLAYMYLTRASK
jgi:hypothetical protein